MTKFFTIAAALLVFSPLHAQDELPFNLTEVAQFDEPWAMAFLPDGRFLVTEQKGAVHIVDQDGNSQGTVRGVPDVDYGGQGGLGDVVLHPNFEESGLVYLSYAEAGTAGTRGAAVARGVLDLTGRGAALSDVKVVWRQYPKVVGYGHYGHRMAFDEDGYLWITSGDRQKFTPSQDMQSNIGKVVRLRDDGSVPDDNPFVDYYSEDAFVDDIGVYPEIWSIGHRNPLGITFDLDGQPWVIEMGPRHGDELNRIERGANYGYPLVSNGEHYDGRPIPDHDTRPDLDAPAELWVPAISPGHVMTYSGDVFADWNGDLLVSGLSSMAIIRVEIDGDSAAEAERYEMGSRIRSVVQGPEGHLWVLEDEARGSEGRLWKLTP
ncbi:MAG: PQQ-dependent sugar dehydrogenase [Pseudomonadota bacterium]